MKRSEMIAFMNSAYDYALGSDYKEHRDDPMAYVLQVMEEEGMQPPMTGKMIQDNVTDRWGMDTGRVEIVRVLRYEWSDENTDEERSSES
jgi:hypothetical protein